MEQFRFPLQKLLDIRADKEEQSKLRLMEAQRQKKTAETKLNELQGSYDRYKVFDRSMSTAERKMKNNYLVALDMGIKTAKDELENKTVVVDNCRKDLMVKQVERKTVEIVKDKRFEAFKKEQNRKEQVQNDEFALYSFMRNIERR